MKSLYSNQWIPLMTNVNIGWKTFRYQEIFPGQDYLIFNSKTNKIEQYICTELNDKKELINFKTNEKVFYFDDFLCFCNIVKVLMNDNKELSVGSFYLINIQNVRSGSFTNASLNYIGKYVGNGRFKLNNNEIIDHNIIFNYSKIPEIPFKFIMNQCLKEI